MLRSRRECLSESQSLMHSKSANTSIDIVIQKKWWVIPLTQYKNVELFDHVEYGFGSRLVKPDQYICGCCLGSTSK